MELMSFFNHKKVATVTAAKNGDKNAFLCLINENRLNLYRVARGILSNGQDIEDAIQNTIMKAFEKINTLKKVSFFRTWLIRILINECNEILRKNKKITYLDKNNISTYSYVPTQETSQLNAKLKTKEGKDYGTINKIESGKGKTKMYISSKYLSQAFPIKILDNTTKEVIQLTDGLASLGLLSSKYNKETNEFIVEYDKELTGSNYTIYYEDHSANMVVNENNIFTVNIEK